MQDPAIENSVVTLFVRGWSMRRIAQELGLGRNRVKRILIRNDFLRQQGEDTVGQPQKRTSKLDPYKEFITELLATYLDPPPTNQRIFELIQEKGYQGGITILRDYLLTLRRKRKAEPIFTVETEPGQRGQHDWSDYRIQFSQTGASQQITIFSFILSYSRRQYLELVPDKTQPTLLRALINTFNYFGGVTKEIRSDNQKACVERWEAGRPIFNTTYLQFATHYQFRPLAIRPGKPRENLKVERPFYYLETNFLNARRFRNRDDFKKQLADWLINKNDLRIHRTTKQRPIDLFEAERASLLPLPAKAFDPSEVLYRIVNNENCVEYGGYYYYVPSVLACEACPVKITAKEIMIYSPDCELLAVYELADKDRKERYIGRPLHRSRAKTTQIDVAELTRRLQSFGPPMEHFIAELKKHKPRSYPFYLRSIWMLKYHYQVEDILIAVKRAIKYRVFEARAIENFLATNAKKRNEPELMPNKNKPDGQK